VNSAPGLSTHRKATVESSGQGVTVNATFRPWAVVSTLVANVGIVGGTTEPQPASTNVPRTALRAIPRIGQ